MVKLIDVYPDEVAGQPALGGYQLMVSADIFRGRYRESFEHAEADRGRYSRCSYRFALPTANHVFLPGHRDHGAGAVELVPALRPQSADVRAEHLLGEAGDYRKATQRVYHAPGQASFIELPVVSR